MCLRNFSRCSGFMCMNSIPYPAMLALRTTAVDEMLRSAIPIYLAGHIARRV
jgi:hypothetical protein